MNALLFRQKSLHILRNTDFGIPWHMPILWKSLLFNVFGDVKKCIDFGIGKHSASPKRFHVVYSSLHEHRRAYVPPVPDSAGNCPARGFCDFLGFGNRARNANKPNRTRALRLNLASLLV